MSTFTVPQIATLRAEVKDLFEAGCEVIYNRWPGRIAICEWGGVTRAMSRKACSPDNAAMEGFFGRVKNEFFTLPRLARGRPWRVLRAARRLPALLSRAAHQALAGLSEPRRVPQGARIRRLGGPRKSVPPSTLDDKSIEIF